MGLQLSPQVAWRTVAHKVGDCKGGGGYPPPPCISYALVQATVGVGTVIIVYIILIAYEM